VLFLCSGSAVDEPARKTNTAKAPNVVIRFTRTNPFVTLWVQPFLSRFYRLGALRGGGFGTGALTTTGSVVDYANGIPAPASLAPTRRSRTSSPAAPSS